MKNKPKQMVIAAFAIFAIAIGAYFCMTPTGAVKLAVALSGHPIKAITSTVTDKSYDFPTQENQIGYSLQNPPYEKDTNSELINWIATKHWIFYTAEYYGWG